MVATEAVSTHIFGVDTSDLRFRGVKKLVLELETRARTELFRSHLQAPTHTHTQSMNNTLRDFCCIEHQAILRGHQQLYYNTNLISNVDIDPERKPGARDHQDRRQKHLRKRVKNSLFILGENHDCTIFQLYFKMDCCKEKMEFFLKVFTQFSEFNNRNISHYTCHLLCTTAPSRHMWET